jgi:outer membrane protein OmpU
MKKILLATTVLAATAGFASAEVAVTGKARMGVISDAAGNVEFTQRLRVYFTGSGETDGGLSFGGTVRNDQSGVGNTANNDSTVFISGAFGKITMGDVGGATNALTGEVAGVGMTSLNSYNEIDDLGDTSANKTAALYTYTAGALSFGLGFGQPTATEKAVSAAVKYSTDMYSVALGYEDTSVQSRVTVSGSATFSGVTLAAKIANNDELDLAMGQTKNTAYAVSASYEMSGVNMTAFFSEGGGYRTTNFDGVEAYGLGASYDLGGGASVVGGVAKLNDSSDAIYDLGVSMAF